MRYFASVGVAIGLFACAGTSSSPSPSVKLLTQNAGLEVHGGVTGGKVIAALKQGDKTTPLLDAPAPKGTTTVEATLGSFLGEAKLLQVRVTVNTKRSDGSSTRTTYHYVLHRAGLKPACNFVGERRTDPGPKCGSGGYDYVSVSREGSGWPLKFTIEQSGGGTYTEKIGGQCMPRSPVRSEPMIKHYELAEGGSCKRR